jgi:threonine dehydrogenase-like Zn-dependent dehydrogenase
MAVSFDTLEYTASGDLEPARLAYDGDENRGWAIARNGSPWLELGAGYRLMRSVACGVCSTDLARRFLPFPLPQVTGHEVIAVDDKGARFAVDINASHRARQIETGCPFCRGGLSNHCPERLVLGIHGLPGGFAPWFLAPVGALRAIPASVPTENAVLIEPLAAAQNAVRSIEIREGDVVAVLGPRKLGMLVIAALSAYRRRAGIDFKIVALARRPDLLKLARSLGADTARVVESEPLESQFDVVIDCTGSPAGFETALAASKREVHLKSTNGQAAADVDHLTEFVVDELALEMFPVQPVERLGPTPGSVACVVGWTARSEPPPWLSEAAVVIRTRSVAELAESLQKQPRNGLPKADAVAVDSPDELVQAIRPDGFGEYSPVRPTGVIFYAGQAPENVSLLRHVQRKNLRLSSSRCGDFDAAIELLTSDEALRDLGARMTTHRFPAARLADAFQAAAGKDCVKAVVSHETS